MSDRYVHIDALPGGWDQRHDNLITLARHLVINADAIRDRLVFGNDDMGDLPPPAEAATAALPPLGHGPEAGFAPEPGEDWPAYYRRVFGIHDNRALLVWLQSPMWSKTDPSPEGAALRIAYMFDYGIPHDYAEIAMGQAYSDYDTSGFMWDKLELLPPEYPAGDRPRRRRKRPAWIGAVELDRRRSAINADFLLPPGEAPFSAGLPPREIHGLVERLGPVPAVYHDFLLLSGRRSRSGETIPYADGLDAISRLARERIVVGQKEPDDPVPPDAIFIGTLDGKHIEFILGGERTDSPVFVFNADTGEVTQTGFSIFDWIADFMATASPPAAPPPIPARPASGTAGRSLWAAIRRLFG